jgi:hypothetical protein
MPYTYGFVNDQPAIADPGLRPVRHNFTLRTNSSQFQNTYHLFIALNQQGRLTTGLADDTYNRSYFPTAKQPHKIPADKICRLS